MIYSHRKWFLNKVHFLNKGHIIKNDFKFLKFRWSIFLSVLQFKIFQIFWFLIALRHLRKKNKSIHLIFNFI